MGIAVHKGKLLITIAVIALPFASYAESFEPLYSTGSPKADDKLAGFIISSRQGNFSAHDFLGDIICGQPCLAIEKEPSKNQKRIEYVLKEKDELEIRSNFVSAYAHYISAERLRKSQNIRVKKQKSQFLEKHMSAHELQAAQSLANQWADREEHWISIAKAEEEKIVYDFGPAIPDHTFEELLEATKRGSPSSHAEVAKVYCGDLCFGPFKPSIKRKYQEKINHSREIIRAHKIPPDYKLAYAHYILSDNDFDWGLKRNMSYKKTRKVIAQKLSKAEIKEAESLAKKWKNEAIEYNLKNPL